MSNQSPEPSMTEPVSVAPAEVPAVPVEVPAVGVAEPKGLAAMTSNLKLIWENRNVRRLQLAFVGSEIGNWAYGMAILVWAYGKGGAVLVGTWAGIRMLLAAFSAPIGGAIADRVPRRTFMLANDAICLALILVTATMIWWDRNIWFVLVPATVLTVVFATRGAKRDIHVYVGEQIDSRASILQGMLRGLLAPLLVALPLIAASVGVLLGLDAMNYRVVVLFAALREKLEGADIPAPFRGTPIALVTAGLMSLAFSGFSGLVK